MRQNRRRFPRPIRRKSPAGHHRAALDQKNAAFHYFAQRRLENHAQLHPLRIPGRSVALGQFSPLPEDLLNPGEDGPALLFRQII